MPGKQQLSGRQLLRLLGRAVLTAALLAGLAAAGGALAGGLWGLAFWARYGEVGIVPLAAARFALAGLAAGALTGGLGTLFGGVSAEAVPALPANGKVRRHPVEVSLRVSDLRVWNGSPRRQPFFRRGRRPRFTL